METVRERPKQRKTEVVRKGRKSAEKRERKPRKRIKKIQEAVSLEVLQVELAEKFLKDAQNYLQMLGLMQYMGDIDINQILKESLEQISKDSSEILAKTKKIPSLQRHPLFHQILNAAAKVCADRMKERYQNNDFFSALKYLILVAECSRITNNEIPEDISQYYSLISSGITADPRAYELFLKAQKMLPIPSLPEIVRPKRYEELLENGVLDPAVLSQCSLTNLKYYAGQARNRKDWQNVVSFQEELVRRDPKIPIYYIRLSVALESMDTIASLERALEIQDIIYKLDPSPKNKLHKTRVIQRLEYLKKESTEVREASDIQFPASYKEVTPEIAAKCPPGGLIQYSIEAQRSRDWKATVLFQTCIIQYNPNVAVGYCVLGQALEHLGRYEEAISVFESMLKCPDCKDIARTIGKIKFLKEKINSRGESMEPAKTVQEEPKNADELIDCIRTLINDHQLEKAEKLMSRLHEFAKHDVDIAFKIIDLQKELELERVRLYTDGAVNNEGAAVLEKSNIDTSSFYNFLVSWKRTAEFWPETSGQGEGWRKIPEIDQEILVEVFENFRKRFQQTLPENSYSFFWSKFNYIERQVGFGRINYNSITTLIARAEKAAGIAGINFAALPLVSSL